MVVFASDIFDSKPHKSTKKRIVYTAKRLNFKHGHLDIRGMEQKLQRFAYKNHDENSFFDPDDPMSQNGLQAQVDDVDQEKEEDQREVASSNNISDIRNFKLDQELREMLLSTSKSGVPIRVTSNRQEARTALSPQYKQGKSITSFGDDNHFHMSIKSINEKGVFGQFIDKSGEEPLRNTKVEINEDHSTVPKILNHLIAKPDTITDIDFLKEDMHTSPKFMFDQKLGHHRMQMRF